MKKDSGKEAKRTKVKLGDLLGRVDSLPAVDSRPDDEILGHDEHGIPESSHGDRTLRSRVPAAGSTARCPDFAVRRKKIFGDRVLPAVDVLISDRGRY